MLWRPKIFVVTQSLCHDSTTVYPVNSNSLDHSNIESTRELVKVVQQKALVFYCNSWSFAWYHYIFTIGINLHQTAWNVPQIDSKAASAVRANNSKWRAVTAATMGNNMRIPNSRRWLNIIACQCLRHHDDVMQILYEFYDISGYLHSTVTL